MRAAESAQSENTRNFSRVFNESGYINRLCTFSGLRSAISLLRMASLPTSDLNRGCVKTQMRDRRMVGRLAIPDCRISTDLLRSISF